MSAAQNETQILGGHSQTDESLPIVTEGWPITRSHADRVQMHVTHWLLGLTHAHTNEGLNELIAAEADAPLVIRQAALFQFP